MSEFAETCAKFVYGKSARLDAPENDNDDFREGHIVGSGSLFEHHEDDGGLDEIHLEWNRRGRPEDMESEAFQSFRNWKRGFHAGRMKSILKGKDCV